LQTGPELMKECLRRGVSEPGPLADLSARFVRRAAIEAELHKGRQAFGRGDFFLRHDDILRPIVRWSLKAAGLYAAGLRAALQPVVRSLCFEFDSLPAVFHGFRILHLSDLHIDGIDGLAERTAEIVSGLPVDVCVITGDYRFEVYGPCDRIYPRMNLILRAIRAKYGVLGILGNHDSTEIAMELARMGVHMLINDSAELRSAQSAVWIAGVDDPHYYGCDDLGQAMSGIPEGGFKVLLAHSPELYDEAAALGIDLYLCGHTHGGQIRLPRPFRGRWATPIRNAACPPEYTYGEWRHQGMQGYTTAGVGASLLPIRYNCPPEIVVIELRRPSRERV
jgi:predicted MPP superfamily phosphohydrolase